MKQYDKIYVPCDDNDSALYATWGEEATDFVGAIQEKEDVIVCTIKELQEVWICGSLSDYLQSKGIKTYLL